MILVRKIAKADYGAMANVFVASFGSIGENWTKENALRHIDDSIFDDHCHYLAEVGDRGGEEALVVGFILAYPVITSHGDELFIDTVAVSPAHQGHGIGGKLFQKAKEYAKEQKLGGISLMTNPKLPSYNWYKQLGMQETDWVEVFLPIEE